jgi:riboflavin synthase
MFTGIIEEMGSVVSRRKEGTGYSLRIKADKIREGMTIGDSIAVNGICLTVTDFNQSSFQVDLVSESRSRTTAERRLAEGALVNLERALRFEGRLHGHLVQGHIDTTTTMLRIDKNIESWEMIFALKKEWKKYLVEKGSIAIDGVSLTISECAETMFRISVIPHTIHNTIIHRYTEREEVNLEFDILGKYVLNALSLSDQDSLSMAKLAKLGY